MDSQVWNINSNYQNMCNGYAIDVNKCRNYVYSEFTFGKTGMHNRRNYCWKVYDNLTNCRRTE